MISSSCSRARKGVDQSVAHNLRARVSVPVVPLRSRRRETADAVVAVALGATGGVSRFLNSVILSKTGLSCRSRRTSNYSCLFCIGLIVSLSLPALAQTTPTGPVHFPAAYTNNAPAATPAPAPVPVVTPATQITPPAPTTTSPPDSEDIHDIRGPISIPYQWLWAAYIVSGFVLAALLFALYRWFRNRVKITAKSPYELALDRLEAARALMTETQVREYAFAVSEIIRSYIEQRFGEKAARRTTEEFLSDLVRQTGTPLAAHRALLEDFMHHCDLPKFARWQLSVQEMESMHASARTFILETRPQPHPAPPAKAPVQPELVHAK